MTRGRRRKLYVRVHSVPLCSAYPPTLSHVVGDAVFHRRKTFNVFSSRFLQRCCEAATDQRAREGARGHGRAVVASVLVICRSLFSPPHARMRTPQSLCSGLGHYTLGDGKHSGGTTRIKSLSSSPIPVRPSAKSICA